MNWFKTITGKSLLNFEKKIANKFTEGKFGYFAVQLSDGDINFLKNSRIKNHLFINGPKKNIVFNEEALPFNSSSIDLIISLHTYEKVTNNGNFIDELFRSIVPGGYLVIATFNPFSLAGIRNYCAFDNYFPWNTKFTGMKKLQNQLNEAGFTIKEGKIAYYQPIISNQKFFFNKVFENIGGRWFPFFGNIYFIVAEKRMPELIPIKPKWKPIKQRGVVAKKYD